MELLLNLAWLLLAVPAWWLWRRESRRRRTLDGLLALACGLVLLFPVISATDDLHAMRAEMEDSSASKRAVRQAAGNDAASARAHHAHGGAELVGRADWIRGIEVGRFDGLPADVPLRSTTYGVRTGRAPPVSFLG